MLKASNGSRFVSFIDNVEGLQECNCTTMCACANLRPFTMAEVEPFAEDYESGVYCRTPEGLLLQVAWLD